MLMTLIAGTDVSTTKTEVFIANKTGLFDVCVLDVDRGVILRWKGIEIRRSQLPKVTPYSHHLIYEPGTRPAPESLKDPYNPPEIFYHQFGTPKQRIVDYDPPIACVFYKERMYFGFYLRGRFYAVGTLDTTDGRPPNGVDQISAISVNALLLIDCPEHRVGEVKKFGGHPTGEAQE